MVFPKFLNIFAVSCSLCSFQPCEHIKHIYGYRKADFPDIGFNAAPPAPAGDRVECPILESFNDQTCSERVLAY